MVVSGGGQKELPVFDLVFVFDELGQRFDGWSNGLFEEGESGFARGAVGLLRVDFSVGENAVFPGGFAAPGAGDDVVDVGFGEGEFAAGVLAATAVAFPKSAQSEAETLAGKAVERTEDDNGGDADFSTYGADGGVAIADGKLAPLVPSEGSHAVGSLDVEAKRLAVDHGAEDFGWSGRRDGLPVPVENEDGGEMKRSGHDENGGSENREAQKSPASKDRGRAAEWLDSENLLNLFPAVRWLERCDRELSNLDPFRCETHGMVELGKLVIVHGKIEVRRGGWREVVVVSKIFDEE